MRRSITPTMQRKLSVPQRHQLRVARKTLTLSDVGAVCMGGPSKEEARRIIQDLTGRPAKED
jgi:hypothetical protein